MSTRFRTGPPVDSSFGLPQPDDAAMAHSARLTRLVEAEINHAGGRIPFDRYMELALYAPGLGYYEAGTRKFGEAGDFVTAPEISPVFGRCLAQQCVQAMQLLQGGKVLEFGAGSGRLAADLLAEFERLNCLPERYLILEVSPDLRHRQRDHLSRHVPGLANRVEWLDGMPAAGFRGVIIANELLDAMPVHRFRVTRGEVFEQFVTWRDGGLSTSWGRPSSELDQAARAVVFAGGMTADAYESEINMRGAPWVRTLAQCVEAGLVLLLDYGHSRREYYHPQRDRGTLMCHYRHRAHDDPLLYPGLQDITAHVDFTAIAEAAIESGFSVCGYNTQAFFLMGCGLERLLAESDPKDLRNHMQLMQGVKRLTLPSEMGERFKVLGLCRNLGGAPIGFSLQDMRERL